MINKSSKFIEQLIFRGETVYRFFLFAALEVANNQSYSACIIKHYLLEGPANHPTTLIPYPFG